MVGNLKILAVLVVVAWVPSVLCKIETLTLTEDSRQVILAEEFGYVQGGTFRLDISNFKLHARRGVVPAGEDDEILDRVGFLLSRVSGDRKHSEDTCLLDQAQPDLDIFLSMKSSALPNLHIEGSVSEGKYLLFFANCNKDTSVSLKADITQYNPGPDYLSIGESPLPMVYLAFGVIHLGMVAAWLTTLAIYRKNVHKVHLFMGLLVNLKTIVLFLDAIRLAYVKEYGGASFWAVMYYFFSFVKGVFLFVVILLVGSGYSLLKPFLSDRDKKVLMIVIPLQIGSNVALMVSEQESPGTLGYLNWHDALMLFDIACCCAVLFPVVWSLRTLRDGAVAEGSRNSKSIEKLVLFRNFYMAVVGWIYFTRIIGALLEDIFSYRYTYLATVLIELSSTGFYVTTGYLFRPVENNPYLKVSMSDQEMDEFSDTEDEVHVDADPDSADEEAGVAPDDGAVAGTASRVKESMD